MSHYFSCDSFLLKENVVSCHTITQNEKTNNHANCFPYSKSGHPITP